MSAATFRIEANAILGVQGSIPLLIASSSEIEVEGEIEASSEGGSSGANANPSDCGGSTAATGAPNRGRQRRRRWRVRRCRRAGGFGGGVVETAGSVGAEASGTFGLRGGCAGGDGGVTAAPEAEAPGGAGGGAVAPSAFTAISITGEIHAGGRAARVVPTTA